MFYRLWNKTMLSRTTLHSTQYFTKIIMLRWRTTKTTLFWNCITHGPSDSLVVELFIFLFGNPSGWGSLPWTRGTCCPPTLSMVLTFDWLGNPPVLWQPPGLSVSRPQFQSSPAPDLENLRAIPVYNSIPNGFTLGKELSFSYRMLSSPNLPSCSLWPSRLKLALQVRDLQYFQWT